MLDDMIRDRHHWTDQDPILAKIKCQLLSGDQVKGGEETEPYRRRQSELSIEDGCILWGIRVVLPPQVQKTMIIELHNGHPGIAKMKNLARHYVWWPKMDGPSTLSVLLSSSPVGNSIDGAM